MESFDVLRILSLVVVWAIPAILVLAVVVFILLAPALTFGGLAGRLFARLRRKAQPVPSPSIAEVLAAAGLTFQEEADTDKAVAAKLFIQQPVSEIDKLLVRAGINIQEEPAPKHCWEMLRCPPQKREACPAFARRVTPCCVAVGLGKAGELSEVCVNRVLLDLKTLPSQS